MYWGRGDLQREKGGILSVIIYCEPPPTCSVTTEPRETFYLPDHQLIIKGCHSGRARWQRCIGRGVGKGCAAFMRVPNSPHLHAFTNPEAFQNRSFWVFMEDSLHRHNWLNQWPLKPIQPPDPFPSRGPGVGLKVPTFQSRGWLLRAFQKPPH